jgi:hypothetical protein
MKNSPNIDARRTLALIRTHGILLAESPDRTALQAMSLDLDHPRWDKCQFPPGTTAGAVAGSDVAALGR